ncbi:MAG: N-acetylneuraminate synthase [Verrucomicrobia bacterium]|nr:N-acetylneuraminate synthase [Verrucomicrobiota bacterium]
MRNNISEPTLVIAEAGVNHNGSLEMAFELIDAASDAGADVVKFQTFKAENLVTQSAAKADYQLGTTDVKETQFEMIKKLELSYDMHLKLISKCKEKGIRFSSTGFDSSSVDLLIDLGVDFIKVPSGEITNLPYLRHVGSKGLPIILSTGMSTMQEVKVALRLLDQAGSKKSDIKVLHCNTEYPTVMEDVNLRAMLAMRDELEINIGYSDHTLGIEVPIAAVALGATVIEKHFTLDRTMEGPDHASSLEPDELMQMVYSIRNIEKAMGDGLKMPSKSERDNIRIVRKSIVASKNIKVGEKFTEDNLDVKRPGTGISPLRWDEILGLESKKDFQADELISI